MIAGLHRHVTELQALLASPSLAAQERQAIEALILQINAYKKIVTDTVEIAAVQVSMATTYMSKAEQEFDKLTVLSIAPLLAQAIKEVFEDGSVTSLFAGRS